MQPAKEAVHHLQKVHGVLNHRHCVCVCSHHHVCNVALDKYIAAVEPADGVCGNTGVGAADPEDLRVLRSRKALEKVGILGWAEKAGICQSFFSFPADFFAGVVARPFFFLA